MTDIAIQDMREWLARLDADGAGVSLFPMVHMTALLDEVERMRTALREIRSLVLDSGFGSHGFDQLKRATIATMADDALTGVAS